MNQHSVDSFSEGQKIRDPRRLSSIWILAWPALINMGSHTLLSVVDLYWVHTFGTEAVAAVSLDGNIIFCMFGLSQILYTGALAMIARRVGAGANNNQDGAGPISVQSFQLSLLLGSLIAGSGALLSSSIIALFEVNETLSFHAIEYLEPMMWSFLPLFPSMVIAAIFTASGDTRTPMIIGVLGNLVNGVLDPFLIFGWAGFPELGVKGAGIATLIAECFALCLAMLAFKTKRLPFEKQSLLSYQGFSNWPTLLKIGVPSGAAAITRPLSTLFLLKVISSFGAEGVAAFGITIRAMSFMWLYHGALGTAVSTLTGQSLGARDLDGVHSLVSKGVKISLLTSFILGATYWIFANEILQLFEKDNELVISLGLQFFYLLVIANLLYSPAVVWASVMVGAGETRSPMTIAIWANWVIKLPLAWLLGVSFDQGVEGIWYAMFISIVFEALAIFLAYGKKKWEKIKI